MLEFWKAADEPDNWVVLSSGSDSSIVQPILNKVDAVKQNNLIGKQFYDTFPRTFKDSNGHIIVSAESNIILTDDYIHTGSCSFQRNYATKSKTTYFECAASC
jgi:hypothetical protein